MTPAPVVATSQAVTRAQIRDVQDLFREYTDWAFTLTADLDETPPTYEGFEEELATLPGTYAPPAGRLLLATVDGRPAGCIALKGHDAATCELKRLYVRPGFVVWRSARRSWRLCSRRRARRAIGASCWTATAR